MASRGVSVLKFVGTVSLGLLTGLSYSLSSLTLPALLTLPTADAASTAFGAVGPPAKKRLTTLAATSAAAYALAFVLSPRAFRHPYLLYAAVLAGGAGFGAESAAPYVRGWLESVGSGGGGAAHWPSTTTAGTSTTTTTTTTTTAAAPAPLQRRDRVRSSSSRLMEASYEVLGAGGDSHSEGNDAGSATSEDEGGLARSATPPASTSSDAGSRGPVATGFVNGEEVREEIEDFRRVRLFQTAVAGLAFLMAVVGIWGDGAVEVLVVEI